MAMAGLICTRTRARAKIQPCAQPQTHCTGAYNPASAYTFAGPGQCKKLG